MKFETTNDLEKRKVLEQGKCEILLSPEKGERKDSLKQIDSGFNHVLGKIATKNKIKIGINIEEISKLTKKEKAVRLSKIRQNLKICKKTKTKLAIRGNIESRHLLTSLGASDNQAKEAIAQSF